MYGQASSAAESWQSTPLPVEWGLVVLDVPGLQNAASLGVIVGVNGLTMHLSSVL